MARQDDGGDEEGAAAGRSRAYQDCVRVAQPVSGAVTDSRWYSASGPKASDKPAQAGPSQPAAKKRRILSKREKAVAETAATNPYDPITYNTSPRAHFTSPPSPSYVPPSPGAEGQDEQDEDGDEGWYDESYALSHNGPHMDDPGPEASLAGPSVTAGSTLNAMGVYPAPSIAVQPTTEANTFEAMSYAMTAQYWAGYWMGVAQAKAAAPPPTQTPSRPVRPPAAPLNRHPAPARRIAQPEVEEGAAASGAEVARPSNVFVTRKQFGKNVNGLKR